MLRCNEVIFLEPTGHVSTYCQRGKWHQGEHSIRTDDPFTPPPSAIQFVLPLRPKTAGTGPEGVPPLPEPDGPDR